MAALPDDANRERLFATRAGAKLCISRLQPSPVKDYYLRPRMEIAEAR